MSTLRSRVAGVGVAYAGYACFARKLLLCALWSSATPARVGHATDIKPHLLGPGLCLSLHWLLSFLFCLFVPSACACSSEVAVTSISPTSFVSLRGISI